MMIVNLTGSGEARVESVFHDFVRLEEDYQQGRTVHHGDMECNLYSSDSDDELKPKAKKSRVEKDEDGKAGAKTTKKTIARKTVAKKAKVRCERGKY